jgi:hypothetical protein
MVKYWLGVALRRRQTLIYMAHHHLLQYQGSACSKLTEELLRYVLEKYRGDFYVCTLFALGQYWERVLCTKHRWVHVTTKDNAEIIIANSGHEHLEDLPVEVTFENGKQMLVLASIPPTESVTIDLAGGVS